MLSRQTIILLYTVQHAFRMYLESNPYGCRSIARQVLFHLLGEPKGCHCLSSIFGATATAAWSVEKLTGQGDLATNLSGRS